LGDGMADRLTSGGGGKTVHMASAEETFVGRTAAEQRCSAAATNNLYLSPLTRGVNALAPAHLQAFFSLTYVTARARIIDAGPTKPRPHLRRALTLHLMPLRISVNVPAASRPTHPAALPAGASP